MNAVKQHVFATSQSTLAPGASFPWPARNVRTPGVLVILAGGVRRDTMRDVIGRSMLDIPVEAGRSLLQHWCQALGPLAQKCGGPGLRLQISLDRDSAPPSMVSADPNLSLHLERDRFDFRGSGGVLADLAAAYGADEYLLVANAARIWLEDPAPTVEALTKTGADVALHVDADGTPTGLKLVRCAALREISQVGYVDFKEQALPQIAKTFRVAVVSSSVNAWSLRTLPEYIYGLAQYHRQKRGLPVLHDAFAEEWRSTFSLIEEATDVAEGACIHDSVVLRGGRVEAGAVVVRSIVCPGGVVPRGETVVDAVVTATQRVSGRRA